MKCIASGWASIKLAIAQTTFNLRKFRSNCAKPVISATTIKKLFLVLYLICRYIFVLDLRSESVFASKSKNASWKNKYDGRFELCKGASC